jgi:dihydroorotase
MAWLVRGARLLDPARGVDRVADVLIDGGRIAKIGKEIRVDGEPETIDAREHVLTPSFVDMHAHLREPGREDAETIETGTRAAAAGGYGAIACMPNTTPPLDSQGAVRFVLERAAAAGPVRVLPIGAVTAGRSGTRLSEIGELVRAGAVAVSDDGDPVASALIMRRALEYARMFDIPVITHAEERSLSGGGVMNEGEVSVRLGLRGIPAASETIAIDRDIRLAELTGGRLHVAHVSTAGGVEIIRRAKEQGLSVTAETAPHYLALTEQSLAGYDPNRKMNPPLRTAIDRDALRAGLAEGVLDAIATDHAPHPAHEKEVEFDQAPFGVVGLETALAVALTYLVRAGHLTLPRLVESLTSAPARILGYDLPGLTEGATAALTLFDPRASWVVEPARFESLSRNTAFAGERLFGKVRAVFLGTDRLAPPPEKDESRLFSADEAR